MKRARPPMPPLAVRVQVAERQFQKTFPHALTATESYLRATGKSDLRGVLSYALRCMFTEPQCDHDPALILRKYNPRIKDVAARYDPHAHSVEHLIYRDKADHQQKTTGRKPGAERTITTKGSDVHLAAKFRRIENPKPKRKVAIRSRPFPKNTRKLRR